MRGGDCCRAEQMGNWSLEEKRSEVELIVLADAEQLLGDMKTEWSAALYRPLINDGPRCVEKYMYWSYCSTYSTMEYIGIVAETYWNFSRGQLLVYCEPLRLAMLRNARPFINDQHITAPPGLFLHVGFGGVSETFTKASFLISL